MPSERPRVVLVSRCFVRDEHNRLLAVQRSASDSHHPGLWECPGGKLDEGQDLSHAQEREVMEETGYLVEPTHPLVFADSYVIGTGAYIGLPYLVLFSITRLVGGKLKLSEEHDAADWRPYDRFLDLELTPEVRKAAIRLESLLSRA
jgi:8-oxo-dGTP diphosphatase